jgi:hypothetical protein
MPRTEAASALKGEPRLIFRPVDDLEKHSALEHLSLEIRSVLFPIGRLPNAKPGLFALSLVRLIGRQGAADALVHHGEIIVRERSIIHRGPRPMKKPPLMSSATAVLRNRDHQKVTARVHANG